MAAPRRLREEEDWRIELQVSLGYTARLHFLRKRKTNNHCIKLYEVIWITAKRENQSSKLGERTAPRLDAHTRTPCQTPSPVSLEARGPPLSLLSHLNRFYPVLGFMTMASTLKSNQKHSVEESRAPGRNLFLFSKGDSLDGWVPVIEKYPKQRMRHTAQSTWSMVLNMDFFNSTHDKKLYQNVNFAMLYYNIKWVLCFLHLTNNSWSFIFNQLHKKWSVNK